MAGEGQRGGGRRRPAAVPAAGGAASLRRHRRQHRPLPFAPLRVREDRRGRLRGRSRPRGTARLGETGRTARGAFSRCHVPPGAALPRRRPPGAPGFSLLRGGVLCSLFPPKVCRNIAFWSDSAFRRRRIPLCYCRLVFWVEAVYS